MNIKRAIQRRLPDERTRRRRDGFTLIELLVVVSIIVVLASVTVAVVATSVNTDRIRGAARQLQSTKQGAMSRAVQAEKPVGVRLLINPNDFTTVNSMIFVEQLDDWQQGTIVFEKQMATDPQFLYIRDVTNSSGDYTAGWADLRDRGLLPDFTRIKIIDADGSIKIYFVNTIETGTGGANEGQLVLVSSVDFGDASIIVQNMNPGMTHESNPIGPDPQGNSRYQLELGVGPRPNEEPLQLPNGSVIDLDNSILPNEWFETDEFPAPFPDDAAEQALFDDGWRATTIIPTTMGNVVIVRYGENIASNRHMDLMFSPQGIIAGPTSATGKIHLLLAEIADTEENRPPEAARRENLIVSIFTATGNVAVYPVDKISPLGANGVPGAVGDDDGNLIADFDGDGVADPLEMGLDDDNLLLRFNFAERGEVSGQ